MIIEEMKAIAKANGYELHVDRDGDVCIRPELPREFGGNEDSQALPNARHAPEHYEFERPEKAEARLRAMTLNDKSSDRE